MELDSIDRRILKVLQMKGRMSNADLSEIATPTDGKGWVYS